VGPRLAIAIINFNGAHDTVECLESLLDSTYRPFAVVVIDNGSKDDSVARLVAWADDPRDKPAGFRHYAISSPGDDSHLPEGLPSLSILETGTNLGFAGGNNVAIRWALRRGAQYVLLLNNDTVVERDTLEKLLTTADEEKAALVGCEIRHFDDPSRVWFSAGMFRWFRSGVVQARGDSSGDDRRVRPTDWIAGCCLMVRRDVFERIGLLDEQAFFSWEDWDFCRRAAQHEFKRLMVAHTRIYHKVSRSSGLDTPFSWYHHTKARLYVHRKHHSSPSHAIFLLAFLLARLGRSVQWLLRQRFDLIAATVRAIRDTYFAARKKAVD
jgi:GT2 family glycosyltransferase